MGRFVIGPDVALALAGLETPPPSRHRLLAPTLLRSQVLAAVYRESRQEGTPRAEASRRLEAVRKLNIRLLGDRVLQRVAWDIAAAQDWPDTLDAEYLALTRLQADAFVTLDEDLARRATQIVRVARLADLLDGP